MVYAKDPMLVMVVEYAPKALALLELVVAPTEELAADGREEFESGMAPEDSTGLFLRLVIGPTREYVNVTGQRVVYAAVVAVTMETPGHDETDDGHPVTVISVVWYTVEVDSAGIRST